MCKESYYKMKTRQQKEFNNFAESCMFFAFSGEQFTEGMKKLGLNPDTDSDKIERCCTGGYVLSTHSKLLEELHNRHATELSEAIKADTTGDTFIQGMFYYEMYNHEYGYSEDITDTLESLSLTMEEINASPSLLNGFNKAHVRAISSAY